MCEYVGLSVCMSEGLMCAVHCVPETASIVAQMRLMLFAAMAVEGDVYVWGCVGGRVGVWVGRCMCVCVWVFNVCGAPCPRNGIYSSADAVYALVAMAVAGDTCVCVWIRGAVGVCVCVIMSVCLNVCGAVCPQTPFLVWGGYD